MRAPSAREAGGALGGRGKVKGKPKTSPRPPDGLAQAVYLRAQLSRQYRRELPKAAERGRMCTDAEWESLKEYNAGTASFARASGRKRRRANARDRQRLREQADRDDAAAAAVAATKRRRDEQPPEEETDSCCSSKGPATYGNEHDRQAGHSADRTPSDWNSEDELIFDPELRPRRARHIPRRVAGRGKSPSASD